MPVPTTDPFTTHTDVPVAGGTLRVARAGVEPPDAADVILAVHGVTSSHLAWRAVARELSDDPSLSLLAPDLRGRGHSAALPAPYGLAAHVADLIAVLDDAGVARAVLAGHSMGAYVAARVAAEQLDRVSALVMLDGGVALRPPPADVDPATYLEKAVGPAIGRLRQTFASRAEYVAQWRRHPALAGVWNDDVEAYAGYDVAGEPGAMRCVVSERAVRADTADLLDPAAARAALGAVRAPTWLLRAPRGFLDEPDKPFISAEALRAFTDEHPHAVVEDVADVNHYTLTLGESPGPARVARTIRAAVAQGRAASGRAG